MIRIIIPNKSKIDTNGSNPLAEVEAMIQATTTNANPVARFTTFIFPFSPVFFTGISDICFIDSYAVKILEADDSLVRI